jgi:hypothetical protein
VVSKVLERIHAESAARLLGYEWQLAEIPEPLDFQVQFGGRTFGLEIRQVFADQEQAFGSPSKRSESLNAKIVRRLADRYYLRGGMPIAAKFVGPVQAVNTDEIVAAMLGHSLAYPSRTVIEIGRLKVYMSAVPSELRGYHHWLYIDDRVGWLRPATSQELQAAVDRKADNLVLYKQRYKDVVLLLVADKTFNSGRMNVNEDLSVLNPGYTEIYFLSHPEAAVRVA